MTKREAAIVSAYTGYLCGDFGELQDYAAEKLGGPVFTHQMGSKEFADKLRELSKEDFVNLTVEG